RGDENPRDLQHVVGPPLVPEEPLVVPPELIPRDAPLAPERRARLLAILKVAERRRAAADPERPRLAAGRVASVGVRDARLVPWDQAAERSGHDLAEPVADVDVEHLRRSDPVEDLDAEGVDPPPVKLGWKRLA